MTPDAPPAPTHTPPPAGEPAAPATPPPVPWTAAALLVILLLGAGLRLIGLDDKSMWVDEIRRVMDATEMTLDQLSQSRAFQIITYLVTRLAAFTLGRSEFAVRFPSAVEGILGIALMYRLGRRLYTREAGLVAAFLLAVSPFHVRWSRDEAFYALMILLSMATLLLLRRALKTNAPRMWVGFTAASIISVYNHTFAFFVLAAQMLYGGSVIVGRQLHALRQGSPAGKLVREGLHAVMPLALAGLVVALAYLPAVPNLLNYQPVGVQARGQGINPRAVEFYIGLFGELGAGAGLALVVFGTVFLLGLLTSRRQIPLILLWMGLPFAVFLLFTPSIFWNRYVGFIVPVYLLVIAWGIVSLSNWLTRPLWRGVDLSRRRQAVSLVMAVLLLGPLTIIPLKTFWNWEENWRDVAEFLAFNAQEEDVIIVNPPFGISRLYYYGPNLKNVRPSNGTVEQFKQLSAAHEKVWVVRTANSYRWADPERKIDAWMANNGFITILRNQPLWLYYGRNEALAEQEHAQETVDLLRKAMDFFPLNAQLRADLGDIYYTQNNFSQALVQYRQAVELNPANAWFYIRLGDTYQATRAPLDAVEAYRTAGDLYPAYLDKGWYRAHLGNAYTAAGAYDEARQELEQAVQLEPDNDLYRKRLNKLPRPTQTGTYLVVVVIDGARPEYLDLAPLPTINQLAAGGASYNRAWVGQLGSVTPPSHATIGTGTLPKRHSIIAFYWKDSLSGETYGSFVKKALRAQRIDFNVVTQDLRDMLTQANVPSLIGAIKQKDPAIQVAAVGGTKFHAQITMGGPDADVVIFSEIESGQSFVPRAVPGQEPPPAVMTALESIGSQQITPLADDSWAMEAALVLFRQMQPRVLLINLPGTDEAGHLTGGSAAGMTPVIKNVDYQIGQLVAAYRSAGLLEQTIFIITSDHGMAEQPPELDTGLMETAFQAAGVKAVPPSRVAASSLWITPWQKANLLAAKIDALNIPQVTGVYYKTLDETTNSFLYQSTPATQQRLDPVLNAAYRYLLDTTAGPRGAEVALTRASPPLALPEHEDTKGQHHEVSWPTQHIPLIIYGPGVKQGFVSDYPARLVDLAPTVLALMGLQAEGMDGLILADALTASTPEQRAAQDALANTLWPLQDALISEAEAAGPQQ